MKKERLEDLGRIYERLNFLYEEYSDMLDLNTKRPKDFVEYFYDLSKEEQENLLDQWAYNLQNIKFELANIIDIAKGEE